ncbi:MAG: ABC transporter substrate-binding protein [Trueperaceae bacterium]
MRLRKWILMAAATLLLTSAQAQTLTFVLDAPENRADEAQAIVAQLREIGIDASVRIWQSTVLRDEMIAGNRNASLTDWGSAYFDAFDLAIPKLRTADRGNYSGYTSDVVDAAFNAASTSIDDATRIAAYRTAQEQLLADVPWVFGYVLQNIEAASDSVQGWGPAADNSESMHDVSVVGSDSLIVGMRSDALITMDPAMYRDRETEAVLRNIFDALTFPTRDGVVQPHLATAWRVIDDKTYEFDLRDDVVFHNGDPLTADDVVFTFWRILTEGAIDGATSPRAGLLGPISHVEKVDDYTVRFVYNETFPQELVLQALTHFQIVPQKYIEEVGVAAFMERPIGSGPFVFARGALDSQTVLERNDAYWRGAPQLQTVVFRMMPEPSTRIAALLSGEVHIIQALPPDLVDRIDGVPGVSVHTALGTRAAQIELNNKVAPFNNHLVRLALNYAVDWDSILTNIYQGYADRLSTAFLPSGFGYAEDLAPYQYDPERAKELLQEAGYRTN